MKISECLDGKLEETTRLIKNPKLEAETLEEYELLQSIANLLYKTKSVRKCIEIIDKVSEHKIPVQIERLPFTNA